MKRRVVDHDRGILEEARRESLRSISELSKPDDGFYYNATSVARGTKYGSYGVIGAKDIPGLLKPYIDDGLVETVRIRFANRPDAGDDFTTGYLANMEQLERIEQELDGHMDWESIEYQGLSATSQRTTFALSLLAREFSNIRFNSTDVKTFFRDDACSEGAPPSYWRTKASFRHNPPLGYLYKKGILERSRRFTRSRESPFYYRLRREVLKELGFDPEIAVDI
jgi:hypothetical protein